VDKGTGVSGLVGIWNRDGKPVERSTIAVMADAMAHRGGDGLEFSGQGPAIFGCHLRKVTPESLSERQPLSDSDGKLMVFDGRIDNRAFLIAEVDWQGDPAQLPDSELVLMAWRRWGDHFPARLAGDFAIAVFIPREHKLILVRDPVGSRPLYYWSDARTAIFASEIKALLAHPEIHAEPNRDLIRERLLSEDGEDSDDGETFFKQIFSVLPGQAVQITARHFSSKSFWDFNPQGRLRYSAYSDYTIHFRRLLTQAIRRRMRSKYPVAVAVDGGLEGSIVTGIAHQIARKSPEFMMLPIAANPHEEDEFVRLLEGQIGGEIQRVDAGSPERSLIEKFIWRSEAPILQDRWCTEASIISCAHGHGARALMSGFCAEALIFSPAYLIDFWKRLSWRRIRRHLRHYPRWIAERESAAIRRRFARELIANLTPAVLRSFISPMRHAGGASAWMAEDLVNAPSRPRARARSTRAHSAYGASIYQTLHSKSLRLRIEAEEKLTAGFGLDLAMPLMDRDVISYLIAIPGEIQNQGGVPGGLLRDAVRGLVPADIRRRRWRDRGNGIEQMSRERVELYRAALNGPFRCGLIRAAAGDRLSDSNFMRAMGLELWFEHFMSSDRGAVADEIPGATMAAISSMKTAS
jgi:asparagine synthase (glutamine-hydrolysing)